MAENKVTSIEQGKDQDAVTEKIRSAPGTTHNKVNQTIGAERSVYGNGPRKTPVRDAIKQASSDIKNVVTQVSDNLNKAPSGSSDDDDNGNGGDGGEG